jgi:hypothetical protein
MMLLQIQMGYAVRSQVFPGKQVLNFRILVIGCEGTVFTVMLSVLAVLDPQELLATTDNVPLLVGVSVQLVPVPTGVPPPE